MGAIAKVTDLRQYYNCTPTTFQFPKSSMGYHIPLVAQMPKVHAQHTV